MLERPSHHCVCVCCRLTVVPAALLSALEEWCEAGWRLSLLPADLSLQSKEESGERERQRWRLSASQTFHCDHLHGSLTPLVLYGRPLKHNLHYAPSPPPFNHSGL